MINNNVAEFKSQASDIQASFWFLQRHGWVPTEVPGYKDMFRHIGTGRALYWRKALEVLLQELNPGDTPSNVIQLPQPVTLKTEIVDTP